VLTKHKAIGVKQAWRIKNYGYVCNVSAVSLMSSFFCPAKVLSIDMLFLDYLYSRDAAEQLGKVWKLRLESAEDTMLDSVGILESNWRLA
jgi:hypothetical protein